MSKGETEGNIFQILSLSGGGARGLYQLQVLAQLEEYLAEAVGDENYNIAKHFDLISGTSIGGIAALALAHGKYNARGLLTIIDKNLEAVFPYSKILYQVPMIGPLLIKLIKTFKQIIFVLYKQDGLKKLLQDVFVDQKIGDLKSRVLVPTVNFSKGSTQIFKTPHHPDWKNDWTVPIVDVALATSAAPTYFPIHEFNDSWYVDGGLAANSPCLMAVHEAAQFIQNQGDKKIRLLSVGTMGMQKTAKQSSGRNKGYLQWALGSHLLELTMSANEALHKNIVEHMIGKDNCLFIDDVQTLDQGKAIGLDDSSPAAKKSLKSRAKERAKMESNNAKFDVMMKHIAPKPTFYYGSNKHT